MKQTDEEKVIDIDKIVREKAGDKARYVPRFLVSLLKRIVHQDRVNAFLYSSRDLVGVDWLEACVRYLDMNLVVTGTENFPSAASGKRFTFVSNHPLGGADGVALGAIVGRQYDGRIKYPVNDLLMNLPGLAPLSIPINKTGSQGKQFPAMIDAGFRSDDHIILFPAGLCSRKRNGEIRDLPWKKTFIVKSVETKRDIVPIHFGGSNSQFFYNLELMCHKMGLKFNLAMLFLVNEMYKNVHKTFEVKIGKPIPWETFDHSKTPAAWAQEVKNIVYQL